jgi:SAM-dependent methyltransferase
MFDALAERYDALFSDHPLGRALRQAVWRHVDPEIGPGTWALDLGCGTGEDALHLAARGARVVALDASAAMLRVARAKVAAAGWSDRVAWVQASLEAGLPADARFHFALSNFGVLNCVSPAALRALGTDLAACLRPGGQLIAVVMGPLCTWEVLWYAAHGNFGQALRRCKRYGVVADLGSGPLTVRYPSPRALAAALAPGFVLVEVAAIGCLLPPTYAAGWLTSRPRLLAWLARIDRRVERWPLAVALADHYLARFERTSMGAPRAEHG